ncbi:hypothetical protein SK128_002888 [Halocaridina rubra]|uniref:Uncharacterized protein n=1 Tax=Halocaridina rubra TaxID=373956 RepID=A0AAN8ZYU4_HALRR
MGGSSYYGGGSGSLNSSAFIGTPRDSMADVRNSTGSIRKRSQLIARDSGSSLGSESSVSQTNCMHHSHTFSAGLSPQSETIETLRRISSTGSINRCSRRDREQSKDSNDSSNEETDGYAYISETASFSLGGSQLTLNSESGSAVSPSQVSSRLSSPRPSIDQCLSTTDKNGKSVSSPRPSIDQSVAIGTGLIDLPNSVTDKKGTGITPSPKRSPMLKSLSQDASTSQKSDIKWKRQDRDYSVVDQENLLDHGVGIKEYQQKPVSLPLYSHLHLYF